MSAGPPGPLIRAARLEELDRLREIEFDADAMYLEVGIGPFANDESENHLDQAAVVFAAEDPPVGFVSVDIVDDLAHVWQLSVLPSAQGRGLGSALLETVCRWARDRGIAAVTLTTFRDVPWNGPFYARRGFRTMSRLGPELQAIRDHEKAIGNDSLGPRIAMRKDLRWSGREMVCRSAGTIDPK